MLFFHSAPSQTPSQQPQGDGNLQSIGGGGFGLPSSNGDLQGCTSAIILNVKAAIKTNTIIQFTKLFIIN
jgi:hypothetical protein